MPFQYLVQGIWILPFLHMFAVHNLHSVILKITKLFLVRQLHHPPSVIQLMVENQIQVCSPRGWVSQTNYISGIL